MLRSRKLLSFLTLTLLWLAPAALAATATEQLQKVIDDHWQYSLQEDPVSAGRMGLTGYNNRLPGVTAADRARRLKAEQVLLQRLQAIEPQQLTDSDRVNHQLLGWVLRNSIQSNKLFLDRIPANTFYSFWSSALDASSGLSMPKVADYQDYIARINDFGRYFDENIANMRTGIKDGFVLPKIVVQGIAPTVRAQVYPDPTKSSLYQPFVQLPASFSQASLTSAVAFSVRRPPSRRSSRRASSRSALILVAAPALAISAEAALAWLPRVFISSEVEVAFIPRFSQSAYFSAQALATLSAMRCKASHGSAGQSGCLSPLTIPSTVCASCSHCASCGSARHHSCTWSAAGRPGCGSACCNVSNY